MSVASAAAEATPEPGAPKHEATEEDLQARVRNAVDHALPFLEREGTAWMQGRVAIQDGAPCVSCHHVGYALWSHAEARRVGVDTLAPAFRDLADEAITFLDRPSVPRAMSAGQVMLAEPQKAAILKQRVLALQNGTGDWSARGQFPSQHRPIAESDAVATMYSLLALRQVSPQDTAVDQQAQSEALAWLDQQPAGQSTEWLAWRLVLADALGSGDQAPALRQNLIGRQRPDGGWGWQDDGESNAFSTGQALYALALVDEPPPGDTQVAAAVEKAILYLLEARGDDGTWRTPSHLISDEPSEPKDVIYHFWGTAWATMGLARSLSS